MAADFSVVGNLTLFDNPPKLLGGNTYGRSFDVSDGDAVANATGVVAHVHGFYQDVTNLIAALCANYNAQAVQNQNTYTPRAVMSALRDVLDAMLSQTGDHVT